MGSILWEFYKEGKLKGTWQEIQTSIRGLEPQRQAEFLRHVDLPIRAMIEFKEIELEENLLPNLLRAIINLSHQSPELFANHINNGLALSEFTETDIVQFTIRQNMEALNRNKVSARIITARASEYINDLEKLIFILKDIQREKIGLPDIHKALNIHTLDFDEINIATLAACDKLIFDQVWARIDSSNKNCITEGVIITMPQYLTNVATLVLLSHMDTIETHANNQGLMTYNYYNFRMCPDPTTMHQFTMIWMDPKYVKFPLEYAKLAQEKL